MGSIDDSSRAADPLRAAEKTVGSSEDELPPPPDMLTFRHFGMYMSYLCVGFIYGSALAFVYPIVTILNREPSNYQAAVQNIFTLFWSFKVFYGYATDNFPIMGLRRKPYLLMGWGLAIAASVVLAAIATINGDVPVCQADKDDWCGKPTCPDPMPEGDSCPENTTLFHVTDLPMNTLIIFMVLNNFGYVMGDVAMDSMAIDYAKREAPENRGAIQGYCYTMRSTGFIVSTAITGFGLNGPLYGGTFGGSISLAALMWIVVGLQAVGLPWWIAMKEDKVRPEQLNNSEGEGSLKRVWEMLNNTAFSKLMIFNVAMSASQCVIVNARQSVLDDWVHMDPLTSAVDSVIGYGLQALTLFAAARWLKSYNWRGLLVFGTAYFIFFIVTFWLVVFDVGPFRNQWFVVFIDADQTFAQSVGYLVVMWACVEMAPAGLEGTTLALTTTVGNAGQSIGNYITMALNSMFALTRDDLKSTDPEIMKRTEMQYFYNALVVIVLQCAFMVLFPWMPKSMAHAKEMHSRGVTSKGWALLASLLVCFAVVWGAGTTIGAVICPNNSIWGGHGGIGGCKNPAPAPSIAMSIPAEFLTVPSLFSV